MSDWIACDSALPEPSHDALHLISLGPQGGRSQLVHLARYRPNPGNESRGHWWTAHYPDHVISAPVLAWMPAPVAYQPAPTLAASIAALDEESD